jgi:hypothetical protein
MRDGAVSDEKGSQRRGLIKLHQRRDPREPCMKSKVALIHLPDQEYHPSSHWPLLEDEIKNAQWPWDARKSFVHEGVLRRVLGGETQDSGDRDPCPSRGSRSGAIAIASHSVPQLKKSVRHAISVARRNNSSERSSV